MKILAIETSCDETAVALLEISGPLEHPNIKILGNSLLSQIHIHEQYGGVVPNLAKREHQKNLPILLEKVLVESGIKNNESSLEAIAVTQGPGLEPALWVGITFAEDLGRKWNKPVIGINHMEGHIYSVLYRTESNPNDKFLISKGLQMPALALLVSGGHTELVHVKGFGDYEIIGRTRDDAVGEAFDKVARILGLPYPGGPQISNLAWEHRTSGKTLSFEFPRPMLHSKDFDFSYSGLKTAVLYKAKSESLIEENKSEFARAFEEAAIDVLVEKTKRALESINVKTLIVAGGVSANTYLKERMSRLIESFPDHTLLIPPLSLATDNAVMIGLAAYVQLQSSQDLTHKVAIEANGNLSLN